MTDVRAPETDPFDPAAEPDDHPRPGPSSPGAAFGPADWLKWGWRQLTSMRIALILLFLLALASVPGSMLPQQGSNPSGVQQYYTSHPDLAPWLDRLGLFNVFAAPWFAAIYLLLFASLVGCVVPRTFRLAGSTRTLPPRAPRHLARLPRSAEYTTALPPQEAVEVAARVLSGRGFRLRRPDDADSSQDWVSAEKGYLRELGNLVFHFSLVGLLVAIAVGKLVGYEGSVIVNVGSQFCSTSPASYDNFRPGLLVDGTDLTPFCLDVRTFTAGYTPAGQAISFAADVGSQTGAAAGGDAWADNLLQVNDPLRLAGERVYLIGHGFTPHFRVTFADGTVRDYEQPFAPEPNDPNFTSQGAVKILDPPGVTGDDVRKHQLAIVGIFAPTATLAHGGIMTSEYPSAQNPGVAVDVYRGDLGMESGRSQSVFAIDTNQVDKGALVKQARSNLMPGESITLDDGTAVTFTGYNEWVSLQTSYDPAQGWALVFAVTLLIGLMVSLVIKRRRVWFRLYPANPVTQPGPGDRTVVEVGGLARTDQAGYGEEFDRLATLADIASTKR